MEIIECNVINSSETMFDENVRLFDGCNDDCWSDDGDCPSFCDHEWGS